MRKPHNLAKFGAMIAFFIERGVSPDFRFRLGLLCFFADHGHYVRYRAPISGMDYYKSSGPDPDVYIEFSSDVSNLTSRELGTLERVWEWSKDKSTQDCMELYFKHLGVIATHLYQIIPYHASMFQGGAWWYNHF